MKKNLYFAALLAAVAFASCQKPEEFQAVEPEVDQPEVVIDAPDFYANIEGQETKAGFTKEGSVYRHYWEVGDVIYVIRKDVANAYPLKYSCTNASTGLFTYVSEYTDKGTVAGTPDKNYAAYGDFYGFNTSTKTFTFQPDGNTVATVDKNGAYGYSNQMVAASEDNNLNFKNTHGWLKLSLKGTQKVVSIDIASFSGSVLMTGEYYVTYDGTSTPAVDVSGMEEPWRRLSISEPYAQLNESTATDFYIALTPLTLNGISVTVNFADGTSDVLQRGGAGSEVTIERNKVTPMAAKSIGAHIVDLSATETANCYIVNDAATTFKFKADVKGNSNESIGTPVKADVLWTTQMSSSITPSKNSVIKDVRYFDGYVYFDTPATYVKGNTVIAARDVDDNILWSWHIWCPGISDVTTDVDDFSAKSAGLQFMKHDLGEVEGDFVPLFYEWGRKDPFIRQGIGLSGVSKTWPATALSIVSGSSTVENSIAHPATFYRSTTWQTPQNDQLWKDDEKTIYDPCPAGWRVQSAAGLRKVLTYANPSGSYFYYTDLSARIPGGSGAYWLGLGTLLGQYDGGIFKFWMAPGDSYWVSLCTGDNVYSLDRVDTSAQFRMSNISFSGSGHPVRCMSDR